MKNSQKIKTEQQQLNNAHKIELEKLLNTLLVRVKDFLACINNACYVKYTRSCFPFLCTFWSKYGCAFE